MLVSSRLIYRKFEAQDLSLYLQLVGDQRVMRYTTRRALSEEEGRKRFNEALEITTSEEKMGHFWVYSKSDHEFIGLGKVVPEAKYEAEIGYSILPKFWGQQLGSEIAKTMVDYAKTITEIHELVAFIDPSNAASRRILEKNGFRLFKTDVMLECLPAWEYRVAIGQEI